MRPLECRSQAPVAFRRVAGHIAQHVGGGFQTAQQFRGREHGDAGGRQLDCEREPADAFAHVRDRGGLICRGAPAGRGGARALGEQCRRGLGRERVERDDGLTAHVQRRLAGDEHAQVPSAFEQLGDGRTAGQDLLEVVEHEQRPPLAQPRREAGRQLAGVVSELERAGDGGQDAGGIADRRERDHERAAGQIVEQPAREGQREAGLTRPARADQRHEPDPVPEQRLEVVEFALAAHERREVLGQVRRPRLGRVQRAELGGVAPVAHHVKEPLRAGEVLEPVLPEVLDLGLVAQQGARRGRDQDLATVGGRPHPRGAVHLQTDVAKLCALDVSGVHAHAHAQRLDSARPCGGGERAAGRPTRHRRPRGRRRRRQRRRRLGLRRRNRRGARWPARPRRGGRQARPATRPRSRAPAVSSPRCR